MIGEEEYNTVTKVKINHIEALNKPYNNFIFWIQSNHFIQNKSFGSDNAATLVLLGIELRIDPGLKKKYWYQPFTIVNKLYKQYIKTALIHKTFYTYTNSLDIETFLYKGHFIPYCIVTIYKNKPYIFYGLDSINYYFNWISSQKIEGIFYAHNLTFDGGILLEYAKYAVGISIDAKVYDNAIYSIELSVAQNTTKIIIKCSFKLLPLSLKKIGELIGIEKLDFNHNNVTQKVILSDAIFKLKSIEYCTRDNEIIIHFINIIKKHVDLNILNKTLSISSLALETFKNFFNDKNINSTISIEWDRIIRPAYFGGRCEVFGNAFKDEYIYHYDFYSMYSQIMHGNFCFGKLQIITGITDIKTPGFYNVTIISNIKEIPVLPYRLESGKLLFPNGCWTGTYWFEELNYFQEIGGIIKKINFKLEFEYYAAGLTNFITHFLKKRENSPFDNIFWKLFINSISGRFGMQFNEETSIIVDKVNYEKKASMLNITRETYINEIIILSFLNKNKKLTIQSNVGIAAAITARGRIKLHRGIMSVINNGGRILYTDTDSIFAAFKKNVDNEVHGEIFWDTSKNDTKILEAIFAIPKGYAVKTLSAETVKLCGFKQNFISFTEFKEAFQKNKKLLSKESLIQKKNYILYLKIYEKNTILTNYDKRIFDENKKTTRPVTIIANELVKDKIIY